MSYCHRESWASSITIGKNGMLVHACVAMIDHEGLSLGQLGTSKSPCLAINHSSQDFCFKSTQACPQSKAKGSLTAAEV